MTVEADLIAVLDPLVSGRVYKMEAPDGVARPYITYQQVGGQTVSFLERAMPSKKHGRMQINCWADDAATTAALMLAVESAVVLATAFQAEAIGAPLDVDGSMVDLFGQQQDFGIWSNR